jgi:hypothetical protein
MTKEEFLKLH